jgi:hypothetical protein
MPGLAGSQLWEPIQGTTSWLLHKGGVSTHALSEWLWKEIQSRQTAAYRELIRLAELAEKQELILSCWCAPELAMERS